MKKIISILADESGATAIEYGLIAALISIAAILAMTNLGGVLANDFNKVSSSMASAR